MEEKIILLVEDNPDDEELTRMALRQRQITDEVVVARDGQEALDWLLAEGPHAERNPQRLPLVVLLDINLPRISGLDVLKRIRGHALLKWLPVAILTSSGEDCDVRTAYAHHANSFIVKPQDPDEFNETVGRLGLYWLKGNVPPPIPLVGE